MPRRLLGVVGGAAQRHEASGLVDRVIASGFGALAVAAGTAGEGECYRRGKMESGFDAVEGGSQRFLFKAGSGFLALTWVL